MDQAEPRNLTEKLIYEVRGRPLLWDKYNDLYNNRLATDREWLNVSIVMNKHKDFMRQKWKNLRDQFQKELRKVVPHVGETMKSYIENYTGKWIYFEQMLFLKDTVKVKRPGNLEEIEIQDDEIKEEVILFEDEPLIEVAESYSMHSKNPLLEHQSNDFLPTDSCIAEIEEPRHSQNDKGNDVGRKRKASEDDYDQPKSSKLAEDPAEVDDDLHFVKSLVPFMRKLNPIRKLMVRNEIQNILLRETLCDKCSGNPC